MHREYFLQFLDAFIDRDWKGGAPSPPKIAAFEETQVTLPNSIPGRCSNHLLVDPYCSAGVYVLAPRSLTSLPSSSRLNVPASTISSEISIQLTLT